MNSVGGQILSELLPDRWADLALETLCKKWRARKVFSVHGLREDIGRAGRDELVRRFAVDAPGYGD